MNINENFVSRKEFEIFEKNKKIKKKIDQVGTKTMFSVFLFLFCVLIGGIILFNNTPALVLLCALFSVPSSIIIVYLGFSFEDKYIKDYISFLKENSSILMINPYFIKGTETCFLKVSENTKVLSENGKVAYYLVFKPFENSDIVLKFRTYRDFVEKYEQDFKKATEGKINSYVFCDDLDLLKYGYEKTTMREISKIKDC